MPEPVALRGRRQKQDLLPLSKGRERFEAWSINTAEDSDNRQYPSNAAQGRDRIIVYTRSLENRKQNKTKEGRKSALGSKIKTEQRKSEHWRRQLQIITLCKHHAGEWHMLEEPSLGTQDKQAGGRPGKPSTSKPHTPGQAQSHSSSGEVSITMPEMKISLCLKPNPFLPLPIAPGNKQQARD